MRIFHLQLTNDKDAGIQGSLETVKVPTTRPSATESNAYEALSYAWGPTSADGSHLTHAIDCDRFSLRVTSSVHDALVRLRTGNFWDQRQYRIPVGYDHVNVDEIESLESLADTSDLALWIDAICINQNDAKERSSQVSQMHRIFQCAYAITVWLGEPTYDRFQEAQSQEAIFGGMDPRLVPDKQLVECLLKLSWFHRRWVIQEVSSTGNCYAMRMGAWECSYRQVYEYLRAYGLNDCAGPMWLRTRPITLLQAMWLYQDSECSDPLDRIYAVRNIATDGCRVEVNYARNVRDAYVGLALAVAVEDVHNRKSLQKDPLMGELLRPDGVQTFEILGWPSVSFSKIRPAEMLRLLVLATCFKSAATMSNSTNDQLPAWVPDWRAQTRFESRQHQEAVQLCGTNDCTLTQGWNQTDLPDGLAMTKADCVHPDCRDYPYLHVPGRALFRPFNQQLTEVNVRLADGNWLCAAIDVPTMRDEDMAWIPWLAPINKSPIRALLACGVGFVVQPGVRGTHGAFPVYRLRECFLLSNIMGGHIRLLDLDNMLPKIHGLEQVEQEFYLE